MAVGEASPEATMVSWKPLGSVAAPAVDASIARMDTAIARKGEPAASRIHISAVWCVGTILRGACTGARECSREPRAREFKAGEKVVQRSDSTEGGYGGRLTRHKGGW